ncbi:hypothetical protein NPIL_185511 [Nephila pilipes]|uniref:Uncharacterized protein n=1 Tax=Nephila pilipes TaxID=299642 RepID=A0A8X6PX20_NEPPI|nr:hypothetical protein NPIL_185511 [Nephila pilipes]
MVETARPHRVEKGYHFLLEYIENRAIALDNYKFTGTGVDWSPYSSDLIPCDYFLPDKDTPIPCGFPAASRHWTPVFHPQRLPSHISHPYSLSPTLIAPQQRFFGLPRKDHLLTHIIV